MPDEYIPRRLQRFYRKKPTEGEVKERSTQIAVSKVDEFIQQNKRYPNKDEINKMADNVYDEIKRELAKGEDGKKGFEEDIDLGTFEKPDSQGKSVLERRKDRRQKKQGEEEKEGQDSQEESQGNAEHEGDSGQEEAPENAPGEEEMADMGDGQALELEATDNDTANVEKLAEIDELSSLEGDISEDGMDMVDKEIETDINVCPRCGNKSEELIYCPKCGEAFCDHCAKALEVQAEALKYTCPKCATEFRKRKSR